MIYGSRGINQHSNGTQTNRALMFLAAMTGNWARPGGGYFNVSSATFIRADAPPERQVAPARPAVGRSPAAWLRAMTEADPYPVTAMIGSNNPFALWPSQEDVRAAAQALELYVHFALFENEANAFADYVLPVASGVEKGGISRASEERRIVWSDKLIDPPGEARSDGWIWIELGRRLGFGDVLKEKYKDIGVFWDEMCAGSEFLRGCTSDAFRASPTRTLRFPMDPNGVAPQTLYGEGTTALGQPEGKRFPTKTGKLEFWTEEQEAAFAALGLSALPEFHSEPEQLVDLPYLERDGKTAALEQPRMFSERRSYGRPARIVRVSGDSPGTRLRARGFDTALVTGRPPAPHFHSWTHDFWQAQEMWPDLYVQIHSRKAGALGIEDGTLVRIETTDGAIEARAWVRDGIRPGHGLRSDRLGRETALQSLATGQLPHRPHATRPHGRPDESEDAPVQGLGGLTDDTRHPSQSPAERTPSGGALEIFERRWSRVVPTGMTTPHRQTVRSRPPAGRRLAFRAIVRPAPASWDSAGQIGSPGSAPGDPEGLRSRRSPSASRDGFPSREPSSP